MHNAQCSQAHRRGDVKVGAAPPKAARHAVHHRVAQPHLDVFLVLPLGILVQMGENPPQPFRRKHMAIGDGVRKAIRGVDPNHKSKLLTPHSQGFVELHRIAHRHTQRAQRSHASEQIGNENPKRAEARQKPASLFFRLAYTLESQLC